MSQALIVVPTYVREARDLEVLKTMLESLRATAPEAEVLVIDDGSPAPDLVEVIQNLVLQFKAELIAKPENEGFSRTVNVGLRRALAEGKDAVLVNADIEFRSEDWLGIMQRQPKLYGKGLAEVVGALLSYPSGLIQHGGIFFSFLARSFGHVYQFAPEHLLEAQIPRVIPVTGALQFIRHESLVRHGVYDEGFRLGHEDVDYCIRVLRDGGECVYQPLIWAYHYESLFRGVKTPQIIEWEQESWVYFRQKWASENFARYVPSLF